MKSEERHCAAFLRQNKSRSCGVLSPAAFYLKQDVGRPILRVEDRRYFHGEARIREAVGKIKSS